MSGNNSMHFLLTPYIVSLKIVFQCVFGTTQQPIPDVATHKVEVGAHGMFVKVMCESFHSMFISLVFPEFLARIVHVMLQVTRRCGCGRWLMAPA